MSANAIVPVKRNSILSHLTSSKKTAPKFLPIPEFQKDISVDVKLPHQYYQIRFVGLEYDNFMETASEVEHSFVRSENLNLGATLKWCVARGLDGRLNSRRKLHELYFYSYVQHGFWSVAPPSISMENRRVFLEKAMAKSMPVHLHYLSPNSKIPLLHFGVPVKISGEAVTIKTLDMEPKFRNFTINRILQMNGIPKPTDPLMMLEVEAHPVERKRSRIQIHAASNAVDWFAPEVNSFEEPKFYRPESLICRTYA